jgi:hypothetical protein
MDCLLFVLNQECGSSYTGQLEGMFKDVNISADLTEAFRQTSPPGGIDMCVRAEGKGVTKEGEEGKKNR